MWRRWSIGIYWWTWKTNNFKKLKKNTCQYHYQNLDDMIYSSWDIEQNKLKLVILGYFFRFILLKTPKIKILKKEKICWRYHHFTLCAPKITIMMYGSWDMEWDRQKIFFVILGHFFALLPPPNDLEYQNFEKKNFKNAWGYYPFIPTCVP